MTPGPGGRTPVGVVGATGLVGQHLVRLLAGHPTLRLTEVAASPARAGRRYGDAVDWVVSAEPPKEASDLVLRGGPEEIEAPLVLSALPSGPASTWEARLVDAGRIVCSNASVHRLRPDVPLVVPEVNGRALAAVSSDAGGGRLVANPNCVVAGLALALAPIERRWGVRSGVVVTLQALSGAGLDGPSALRMAGNVVPHIEGEEEKIAIELGKILGRSFELAVAVNRVPVVDGHMAHLFLTLGGRAAPDEVREAIDGFGADPDAPLLPTLPDRPVAVTRAPDRPQPRLDAGRGAGMTVTVGRVRAAPPHDVALTIVVNNVIRGAAGACLANAELCAARGLVGPPP